MLSHQHWPPGHYRNQGKKNQRSQGACCGSREAFIETTLSAGSHIIPGSTQSQGAGVQVWLGLGACVCANAKRLEHKGHCRSVQDIKQQQILFLPSLMETGGALSGPCRHPCHRLLPLFKDTPWCENPCRGEDYDDEIGVFRGRDWPAPWCQQNWICPSTPSTCPCFCFCFLPVAGR